MYTYDIFVLVTTLVAVFSFIALALVIYFFYKAYRAGRLSTRIINFDIELQYIGTRSQEVYTDTTSLLHS